MKSVYNFPMVAVPNPGGWMEYYYTRIALNEFDELRRDLQEAERIKEMKGYL